MRSALLPAAALACLGVLALAPPSQAMPSGPALGAAPGAGVVPVANWHCPYCNVDPRNDMGNDTGDSQVESLNAQQLNQNYRGPYYYPPSGQGTPHAYGAPPPGYGYGAPPPGYGAQPYPPPPGYPHY